MGLDQMALAILSITAVYLATDKRRSWQRFGPIFGLCSQPFWLYTAWTNMQWGILLIACIYTIMWIRGIINFWWIK